MYNSVSHCETAPWSWRRRKICVHCCNPLQWSRAQGICKHSRHVCSWCGIVDSAQLIVRIGFQRGYMPCHQHPFSFWSCMNRRSRRGVVSKVEATWEEIRSQGMVPQWAVGMGRGARTLKMTTMWLTFIRVPHYISFDIYLICTH